MERMHLNRLTAAKIPIIFGYIIINIAWNIGMFGRTMLTDRSVQECRYLVRHEGVTYGELPQELNKLFFATRTQTMFQSRVHHKFPFMPQRAT
jgi:hypothetical protein